MRCKKHRRYKGTLPPRWFSPTEQRFCSNCYQVWLDTNPSAGQIEREIFKIGDIGWDFGTEQWFSLQFLKDAL
jgi:hypothetical protein